MSLETSIIKRGKKPIEVVMSLRGMLGVTHNQAPLAVFVGLEHQDLHQQLQAILSAVEFQDPSIQRAANASIGTDESIWRNLDFLQKIAQTFQGQVGLILLMDSMGGLKVVGGRMGKINLNPTIMVPRLARSEGANLLVDLAKPERILSPKAKILYHATAMVELPTLAHQDRLQVCPDLGLTLSFLDFFEGKFPQRPHSLQERWRKAKTDGRRVISLPPTEEIIELQRFAIHVTPQEFVEMGLARLANADEMPGILSHFLENHIPIGDADSVVQGFWESLNQPPIMAPKPGELQLTQRLPARHALRPEPLPSQTDSELCVQS
jgi:hypothetical protein